MQTGSAATDGGRRPAHLEGGFHRPQLVVLAAAICLACVGCGPSGPAKYSVHGLVTYQGKPATTGNIMFASATTPTAACSIAEDGTYKTTVAAGKYRVGIKSIKRPPPGVRDEDVVIVHLIPAKYNQPNSSGLEAEVRADSDNVIDFNLK